LIIINIGTFTHQQISTSKKLNPLKKLASQTAIYGLPTIVGRLLNYFLTPLYTYIFSTGDYGIVTSLYAYVSFLLVLLTYGMETTLFRFSQSEGNKQKVYSTILISVLSTSLLFVIVVKLFDDQIARSIKLEDHPEYVFWFALILAADAITAIPFAKLREQNLAKKFALIKSINIASNIFLNVFFIWYCNKVHNSGDSNAFVESVYNPQIGIGYIFISNLIASLLTLLLLLPGMLKIKFEFDAALWKKILIYSLPLLIAGMAGMINETMDRILLTYLLPEDVALSQTGIYGACYKVSIIMTIFIQTFRFAAEPFFFANSKEKDAKQNYAKIMKYFVIACSIIFLATMANISWIQYFVGEPFREGMNVVPILLLANLCLGIFINQSIWYKLTGQTGYGAVLAIIGATITLVLNIWWIPLWGYTGSAWATLICYAGMMIISYFWGNKHYPVNYDLKRILAYIAISLTLYGLSYLIASNNISLTLVINNILLFAFVFFVWKMEKKNLMKKPFV